MRSRAGAIVILLLAARASEAEIHEIITLKHSDARAVCSWLEEAVKKGERGLSADKIEKIQCIPRDNAIFVSGEKATIERIRMLLARVDVPVRQIEIRCKIVELEKPELLLGTVELPPEASVGPRPPEPEAESGSLLAINPHLDASMVEQLLDNGRATILHYPHVLLLQAIPGEIAFVTEHEGEVYGPRLGFAARMTDDELITVEASLHFTEPPQAGVVSPNVHMDVRYTALSDQTVAVGLLPKSKSDKAERGIVFLITARPVRDVP